MSKVVRNTSAHVISGQLIEIVTKINGKSLAQTVIAKKRMHVAIVWLMLVPLESYVLTEQLAVAHSERK